MTVVAAYATESTPRGTNFAEVVLFVQAQLVQFSGLKLDRVPVVADRKIDPKALGETHLRVRPLRRKATPNPGSGRLADYKTRTIAVDVIVRQATDSPADDTYALTNKIDGLLYLEEKVLDALDLATPEYDDIPLTVEPMRETDTDDPNRPEPGDGFVTSTILFETKYLPLYALNRV